MSACIIFDAQLSRDSLLKEPLAHLVVTKIEQPRKAQELFEGSCAEGAPGQFGSLRMEHTKGSNHFQGSKIYSFVNFLSVIRSIDSVWIELQHLPIYRGLCFLQTRPSPCARGWHACYCVSQARIHL